MITFLPFEDTGSVGRVFDLDIVFTLRRALPTFTHTYKRSTPFVRQRLSYTALHRLNGRSACSSVQRQESGHYRH